MSFKSWCQRARIAAAIEKLSTEAGVSVKQLASDFGYASVPAFSHAFRQVTGKTPTEFAGNGTCDTRINRMPGRYGKSLRAHDSRKAVTYERLGAYDYDILIVIGTVLNLI